MNKYRANEWHQIQKRQAETRKHGSPPLKRQNREKIFSEIVDDSQGSLGPMNRDQIFPENIALSESGLLNHLAEFHVVENFHPEALVGSDRFVGFATNHVECADSHVIVCLGIGDFPRAMPKHE